jgi:hypothetical protein
VRDSAYYTEANSVLVSRFNAPVPVIAPTDKVGRVTQATGLLMEGLGNYFVSIPLEKSSDGVEDVKDDRPFDPASKRFDLLASSLTL